MTDIKQALKVAQVRSGISNTDIGVKFGVTNQAIRDIAAGVYKSPRNPEIREYLENFCKEHAPEDYARCIDSTQGVLGQKGERSSIMEQREAV